MHSERHPFGGYFKRIDALLAWWGVPDETRSQCLRSASMALPADRWIAETREIGTHYAALARAATQELHAGRTREDADGSHAGLGPEAAERPGR